jgi:hypothetical protein
MAKKPSDVSAEQACTNIRRSCALLGLPDKADLSLKALTVLVNRVIVKVADGGCDPSLLRDLDQE